MRPVVPAAIRRRRDRRPRPDAWCSPGREHVQNGACHCRGSSKTAPVWEYQFTAAIGHLRTRWAALVDVARTVPEPAQRQMIAQVKNVLGRLRRRRGTGRKPRRCRPRRGDSAAALADGLLGGPVHAPVRLAAGQCPSRARHLGGQDGRPPRRGAAGALPGACGLRRCRCWQRAAGPEEAPAPEPGTRRGTRSPPVPRSTAPSGLGPGHGVHPLSTATATVASPEETCGLPGTLIHVTVERRPTAATRTGAMWLWHAGPWAAVPG